MNISNDTTNICIDCSDKTILVTGAAGFIGYYLCRAILLQNQKVRVVGFDNLNDYYDVSLKEERLRLLKEIAETEEVKEEATKGNTKGNIKERDEKRFFFVKGNLQDSVAVQKVFSDA